MAIRKKTDAEPETKTTAAAKKPAAAKPKAAATKVKSAAKEPAKAKKAAASEAEPKAKAAPKKVSATKKASTTTKKTTASAAKSATAKAKASPAKASARTPKSAVGTSTDAAVRGTGRSLVVVESPAKAKTLQKYLGPGFRIEASVGHVMDLPTKEIGVDIDHGFEPKYEVLRGKEKVLDKIRTVALGASEVFLAPDPDREGEAIAWHIAQDLTKSGVSVPIRRATFNEITKKAVSLAIANPRELDQSKFEAQQARRVLDRLVGYKLSPLLWSKVTRGLSAGRVQSVAVRQVVEREREISAFVAQEYWSVEADATAAKVPFEMRLAEYEGAKPQLGTADLAKEVLAKIGLKATKETVLEADGRNPERKLLSGQLGATWTVASIEKKDVKRRAAPPFITSTLQQEASRKLGYGAQRTMGIAQKLYEGIDLGSMGQTALITYMRTDSTRISDDAVAAAREYIVATYGQDFVPAQPNAFRTKKDAQDAHEAIRPVDMALTPENVAPHLEPDMLKLYTLIWNRFIACQMSDALFEQTRVEARPVAGVLFVATGQVQKFAGFLAVYEEGKDDSDDADDRKRLPALKVGDSISIEKVQASQHFTQPPPRYTEATLVKDLERLGIGRPSTYASIVSVIQDKEYVSKDDSKRFHPTELGFVVTDLLVGSFPEIMDTKFTARMEERLDDIETGDQDWRGVLGDFWKGFSERLDEAKSSMRDVKREEIKTDITCDRCGEAQMVVKWGRNGRFLACPRYPECRNTREYNATEAGEPIVAEVQTSDEACPLCGRMMVVRNGRTGRFLACPGYPECKGVKPFKTGVKCPKCKTGDLCERVSKKGRMFYSCSNYRATPSCDFVEWNRPVPKACPKCNNSYLIAKETSRRRALLCPVQGCGYAENLEGSPEEEAAVR